jgi:hypothetical protein
VPPTNLHLHDGARQSLGGFLSKAFDLHCMPVKPVPGEQSTGSHGLPEDLSMGRCSKV